MNYVEYFDHTLLSPTVNREQLTVFLNEAVRYGFRNVCVSPTNVDYAVEFLSDSPVGVCSVVGFPSGSHVLEVKEREAELVCLDGAVEFDYVVNLSFIANGDWGKLEMEARRMKTLVPDNVTVKAIIESGIHSDEEVFNTTAAVSAGGVDFVKTCSGFNGGAAELRHVELMFKAGAPAVKASGGVKTLTQVDGFINTGVTRFGSSNSVFIVEESLGNNTNVSHIVEEY